MTTRPTPAQGGWRAALRGRRGVALCLVMVCVVTLARPAVAQTRDAQGDVEGWPSENPPPPLPAHEVPFPPYEVRTLPNGLQVVVVQHHEEPAVSMRLIVRAGSAEDPKGQMGLANLEAALLDQGTPTQTAEQIADSVDSIGGGLDTGAGIDLTYAGVLVMKDSFGFALHLLSNVIRDPAFAQTEIDRQKSQLLAGLRVSAQDPSYVADEVFNRLVYGFHPYGLPQEGTPASIAGITRQDLQAFHDAHFVPNNSILAIVGDVMPAEAFTAAQQVFGDWVPHDVPVTNYTSPPESTSRVIVINKPDAVQTEIRVGNIGVPRKTDDYMALNLAIRVLGGEGSDRLQQVLRTERGLTYGAEADFDTYKLTGDIVAETNTRSAATAEVLRLIVNEFWRLQEDPVSPRELNAAKDYMTGSFPLTIETPEQIAMQVLNALFYDLPLKDLQTFRERVDAVSPADVQRVARWYLKPSDLSVVLVGNAAAFVGDLKGAGFSHYDVINLPDLDLTAPDLRRATAATAPAGAKPGDPPGAPPVSAPPTGAVGDLVYRSGDPPPVVVPSPVPSHGLPQPPRVTPTPEEQNRGQEIIAQAIKAKGGLPVLKNIRTVVADATTMVMAPHGPTSADTKTYIRYPDQFRVEAHLQVGNVVQVYDAGKAWVQGPNGVQDAPDTLARAFHDSVQRDIIQLLIGVADGRLLARGLPDVTEGGRTLHPVELSSDELSPTTLYIDAKTGQVAKETYTEASVPGGMVTTETFSDYRSVDGVMAAFKARIQRGSVTVVDRTVKSLSYNAPVDAALFHKPAA